MPDTGNHGQDATSHRRLLAPGDRLAGRFEIVGFLGAGAVGEVYAAEDRELGERVAVKVLRREVTDDAAHERFRREIQLARRVTHPNVCRAFDLFRDGDLVLLSMELLAGETLREQVRRRGRLPAGEALGLLHAIADGLAAAHSAGVVHRDLKTGNVFLVPRGGGEAPRVAITDFGLARLGDDDSSLTGTGELIGSPAYMAPEQVRGEAVTTASDVYALGVIAYELVTGELPFHGPTAASTALKRLSEPPPSPCRVVPGLDRRWETAIHTALGRDPADRFTDPRDLPRAIAEGTAPPRRWRLRSPRPRAAALIGALLLAALVGAFFLLREPSPPPEPTAEPAQAAAQAANAGSPATDPERLAAAEALLDEGNRHFRAGDDAAAGDAYRRAFAAWEELGRLDKQATALNNLGNVLDRGGDPEAASEHYRRALALRRAAGDPVALGRALLGLGRHRFRRGDMAGARDAFEEALVLATGEGDERSAAQALGFLAFALKMDGDLVQAEEAFRRGLATEAGGGDARSRAALLGNLAGVALTTGRFEEAEALWRQAAEGFRASGYPAGLASVAAERAELALLRGDPEGAERLAGEAADAWRSLNARAARARARVLVARARAGAGRWAAAAEELTQAVGDLEEVGGNSGLHEALAARASLARHEGDPAAARRDLERSLAIRR
ncbi:MAG TPA: serine/threonine-protein kinase, partial [Thermoanaerobaculia bacterium]|nr:serine/threonine-protein kinase [Thermoanaerobaculia bacterium]